MKKIKNIIYKLRLKLLLFRNFLYRKLNKYDKRIIIASSNKYVNRVKEDINLCYYLLKNGIYSEIKDWKNISNDENIIIRSVWGYQNEIDDFNEFLANRKGITINSVDILNKNISKKEQYEIFKKYNISCIDTQFVYDIKDIDIKEKSVIKPIISASGNNTYIVNSNDDIKEDLSRGYMVQPYIEEINNGEYSIILFDKELLYGIRRYPGIFTNRQSVEYISDIDDNIKSIINDINKIDEYNDYVFMRVDIVDNKVIEIELLDPQLFIETIPDKSKRIDIYIKLVNCIKDKLK
jgi:glutathione synthase/RimK-type ligase-like ATP-grasp enzyme